MLMPASPFESVYYRLPIFLQNAIFSGYGWGVSRKRYNRSFRASLERLKRTEWWRPRSLIPVLTSGTTGTPLTVLHTRESLALQWAVWWRHKARQKSQHEVEFRIIPRPGFGESDTAALTREFCRRAGDQIQLSFPAFRPTDFLG
jgi:acyl-CoA synthetase (AMP-forming)/AMP-acid ligase II